MNKQERKPILYKGELYSIPVLKRNSGGSKALPFTYEQAKEKIMGNIKNITSQISRMSESARLPNEIIMCMRMHPDFSAKSYYPDSLFDSTTEKFGLQEVGSRIWKTVDNLSTENKEKEGKLYFVRGTQKSLQKLTRQLEREEFSLTKKFKDDVCKLVNIDLLSADEQISGIPDDWTSGRLEAVLHPFDIDKEIALDEFLKKLSTAGVDLDKVRYKQYDEGITFISLYGDRSIISGLSGYNPLRTLHPLSMRNFAEISRGFSIIGAPKASPFANLPEVIVGVIDGGYITGNPVLDPYVETEDCVTGEAFQGYCDHGTQVTSAVLYGSLNRYKNSDQLPEPMVRVKNFRVLSSETSDPDLYEVIDAIENIIPLNNEIKVYNLSLGPSGQILDDHICRFTFACDSLIYKYGIIFCTAVGNDGELDGYNRIQAPADMINGLAVSAFSKVDNVISRAPYSCIGPGREGNKLKPDLSAFGGCAQNPIQLFNEQTNSRVLNCGTSFASPLVSSATSQLMGYSDDSINNLVARALIIHGVSERSVGHSYELGHGVLPDDIQQFVSCPNKTYTLIYNGEIEPGKYVELPIPWTDEITEGNANFRWTVATLTAVDPQSPDDYSTSSIVTSFYPNSSKFKFKNGSKTTLVDIDKEADRVVQLMADGWVKDATFPVSESGQTPFEAENELRADYKWDSLESRKRNKKASMVRNPMFHLHALQRGQRFNADKVQYALILTVEAAKAEVDLYSKVRANYSALVPIRLDIDNQIEVRIGN